MLGMVTLRNPGTSHEVVNGIAWIESLRRAVESESPRKKEDPPRAS